MFERELSQEVKNIVASIVRADLGQRFSDGFVFGPILVEPDTAADGFEYLDIKIIFDGDQKLLDPIWTGTMIGRVLDKLEEQGIEGFPLLGFIEKGEWLSVNRRHKSRRSKVDAE